VTDSVQAADTRRYPDRPFVGVGAVIVQDGKVLLVKRRYEPLAGQWSLPGGAVEVGEMLEETGLEVRVGPVIEVFDRITHDAEGRVMYHFVLVDYLCWPTGGTLCASSDVAEVRFADPRDLFQYDLTTKATSVVERALELDRQTQGLRS
jgi:8-oxo-dGTP diphosphatase